MFTPTESEFDILPLVVRRKCFSTLERLRLAECPTSHIIHGGVTKTRKPLCIPVSNSSPRFLARPRTGRISKSLTPADVSQEDAQWYQRLPDTVRRKQFSLQEQLLLAGRSDSVILDAADEALYRLGGRQANRSLPSLQTSSSTRSSACSLNTIEMAESAAGMDSIMMNSFRWLDEEDNLDLTLDDYHTHIVEAAMPATKSSTRRPSFRRNLSLTNLPFGRDSRSPNERTSSTVRRSSLITGHTPPNHSYRLSMLPLKQHTHQSHPSLDPPAAHYQDPEARLKLRVYLASPQKFDEALEFGFPSLQGPTPSRPSSRRPSLATQKPLTHTTTTDLQTFYDDDNVSLFRDQGEEDIPNVPDNDHLDSELDTDFRNGHRLPAPKPRSSEITRPQIWHTASEPYAHAPARNREMTLRMTLTRPDLRADESILYPKGEDPLALDNLLPVADNGDIWDNGQKEDSVMKKLWRRVSRKM